MPGVDGENFDFMFYKKLIMTTANDTDYGVRKKNLRRRYMTSKVIEAGWLVFQEKIEVQSDEENEQPTTEDENTTENNTGIDSNSIDDGENKDLIVID